MKHFVKNFIDDIGRRIHHKVHPQVKDRLFRFLFDKDREALLQLYNALNGTDYQNASQLEVVTIESAVYVVMKNDLAFMIAGVLNLYEHQSTINPNMPVRFLVYLAQEYQLFVEQTEKSLYGRKQILLPTPHCVVFYNGDQKVPEKQILKLSDAFENKTQAADVELSVSVLNINYGHNKTLMEKCKILEEYAKFVEVSKQFVTKSKNRKESLHQAIEYCIENHILESFLKKYRQEVLGMLLEEFDQKKYEHTIREESLNEGIAIGKYQVLTENVDSLMKNLNIDLSKACSLLGITAAEYEEAMKNKRKAQNYDT